jgi:DNA-binding MarR family transcriptional regulator
MTHYTLLLLRALMMPPGREMYGMEIMRAFSLGGGTVYPLLRKALDAGWITGRAEEDRPADAYRPPRCYYKITPAGEEAARQAIEEEERLLAALGIAPARPVVVGGIAIPVTVDERQPDGTVGIISGGEAAAFRLPPGNGRGRRNRA